MASGGRRSVVDVALRGGMMEATQSPSRAKVLDRLRLGDRTFHFLTRSAALAVLGILGGVMFSLVVGAIQKVWGTEIKDASGKALFVSSSN